MGHIYVYIYVYIGHQTEIGGDYLLPSSDYRICVYIYRERGFFPFKRVLGGVRIVMIILFVR